MRCRLVAVACLILQSSSCVSLLGRHDQAKPADEQKKVTVHGVISTWRKDQAVAVSGVTVVILRDGQSIGKVDSNDKGEYAHDVQAGGPIKLKYSKSGYREHFVFDQNGSVEILVNPSLTPIVTGELALRILRVGKDKENAKKVDKLKAKVADTIEIEWTFPNRQDSVVKDASAKSDSDAVVHWALASIRGPEPDSNTGRMAALFSATAPGKATLTFIVPSKEDKTVLMCEIEVDK